MNTYQLQEYAKDHGYTSVEFYADFPAGRMKCRWLDAYFGLFVVEGIDGFLRMSDVRDEYPDITVELIGQSGDEE